MMIKVTYVDHELKENIVAVPLGHSLMEAAKANNISGIVGECGGSMMCATCHVYVDTTRQGDLPEMSETEDAMLDSTICERRANSRLSCQLIATSALDGLKVEMPETQT